MPEALEHKAAKPLSKEEQLTALEALRRDNDL
jgi:hypothetical protein